MTVGTADWVLAQQVLAQQIRCWRRCWHEKSGLHVGLYMIPNVHVCIHYLCICKRVHSTTYILLVTREFFECFAPTDASSLLEYEASRQALLIEPA